MLMYCSHLYILFLLVLKYLLLLRKATECNEPLVGGQKCFWGAPNPRIGTSGVIFFSLVFHIKGIRIKKA